MSEHVVDVVWNRGGRDFTYQSYSRDHEWRFQGSTVAASAAPGYRGNPDLVDPEEAFVAAISSCHMLTFLALCTKEHLVVDSYEDHAVGTVEKDAEGRMAVTRVVLSPRIKFEGDAPDTALMDKLHHMSHEMCFIANSVKTAIEVA